MTEVMFHIRADRTTAIRSFQRRGSFAWLVALVLVVMGVGCGTSATHTAFAGDEYAEPGPYFAGWKDVAVSRGGSGEITATLYYPATEPGASTPFDATGGPYPAVSFGHGFLTPVSQYESTLEHLATWGYFAIASKSEGGLFPSHRRFAEDLRYCLDFLEAENADDQSEFFASVDVDSFGLSGHSMGGGCSMLAAADEGARLKAVCNLAAAETNPSAIAAAANITAPVSLIAGSEDSITPITQHGQRMYDNLILAPGTLPVIRGGFHCGFIDSNIIFCDSGSISRDEQLRAVRRYLTAFFNLYLKEDERAWWDVWGPGPIFDSRMDVDVKPGGDFVPYIQSRRGDIGEILDYEMEFTNTGATSNSFTMLADSRWPIEVSPNQIEDLAPGGSAMITVRVLVKPSGSARNIAVISARSDADDLTRAIAGAVSRRNN